MRRFGERPKAGRPCTGVASQRLIERIWRIKICQDMSRSLEAFMSISNFIKLYLNHFINLFNQYQMVSISRHTPWRDVKRISFSKDRHNKKQAKPVMIIYASISHSNPKIIWEEFKSSNVKKDPLSLDFGVLVVHRL